MPVMLVAGLAPLAGRQGCRLEFLEQIPNLETLGQFMIISGFDRCRILLHLTEFLIRPTQVIFVSEIEVWMSFYYSEAYLLFRNALIAT